MAKAVFLTGWINMGGGNIYVTNLEVNEAYKVEDTTDLSTTLGESDFDVDKRKVAFTLEAWRDVDAARPARGTKATLYLNMENGGFTGTAFINNYTEVGIFDTAIKIVMSGTMYGDVSEFLP